MTVGLEFGRSLQAYQRFRPPYPRSLYDRVFTATAGSGLAVDLGAGTGLVCAQLEDRFARVIAVEPDPAMASHLRASSAKLEVQEARAEEAELPDAGVDLVTCANAFHWMEGAQIVAHLGGWLRPGAIFAGWRYPFPTMPGGLAELMAQELRARWGPFHDPRIADMGSMRRCFEDPRFQVVFDGLEANSVSMDSDALLGFLRSTSFGSAYLRSLSEPERRRYRVALEAEVDERMPADEVEIDMGLSLLIARRV